MTRLTLIAACIAALSFGCGDDGEGTAGTGGSAGAGGAGGSGMMIHGCTEATATDMTGMAAVTITDTSGWAVPHSACIVVSAGTVVTWEGNFTAHPLVGGETPTTDDSSIVTINGSADGMVPVDITFDTAGTFPYFCGIHVATMTGVIYVQ